MSSVDRFGYSEATTRTMEAQQQADTIHSCSYYCTRPECIRAQRDELRDRMEATQQAEPPTGLPLDLDHEPADLAEAKEMLRRAKALTFTSLDGLHRAMDAAKQQVEPCDPTQTECKRGGNPASCDFPACQQRPDDWVDPETGEKRPSPHNMTLQQAEPVVWAEEHVETFVSQYNDVYCHQRKAGVGGGDAERAAMRQVLILTLGSYMPRITTEQVEQIKRLADEYALRVGEDFRDESYTAGGRQDKARAALHAALDALVKGERHDK